MNIESASGGTARAGFKPGPEHGGGYRWRECGGEAAWKIGVPNGKSRLGTYSTEILSFSTLTCRALCTSLWTNHTSSHRNSGVIQAPATAFQHPKVDQSVPGGSLQARRRNHRFACEPVSRSIDIRCRSDWIAVNGVPPRDLSPVHQPRSRPPPQAYVAVADWERRYQNTAFVRDETIPFCFDLRQAAGINV